MNDDLLEKCFVEYQRKENNGKLISVKGRCLFHNAPFEFSILPQNSNRYLLRGRIKAVDASGEVLRLRGKDRADVIKEIEGKSKKEIDKNKIENNPRLKVMKDIYCSTLFDCDIKKCIYDSIKELYDRNRILINSQLANDARPGKITLFWAIQKKGRAYISEHHNNASPESQDNLYRRLSNICEDLPEKAMASYSIPGFDRELKEHHINDENLKELKRFWDYCIDAGICEGENPIIIKRNNRNSSKRNQRNAVVRKELDIDEQNRLYDVLEKTEKIDTRIGVALMISGFPVSIILQLHWKDIIFKSPKDNVIVRYNRPRAAGATQDYSRPVVPRSALIIRDAYLELKKKNPEIKISDELIISSNKKHDGNNRRGSLIQDATRLLQAINISYARIGQAAEYNEAAASTMLSATYKRNIYDYCNLKEDSGTCKYLLGEAFKNDTTSDSYTAFSDKAGLQRLYDILQILKKPANIIKQENVIQQENGQKIVQYFPKRTNEYALITGDIGLIPPGGRIKIVCKHGVIGTISGEDMIQEAKVY